MSCLEVKLKAEQVSFVEHYVDMQAVAYSLQSFGCSCSVTHLYFILVLWKWISPAAAFTLKFDKYMFSLSSPDST